MRRLFAILAVAGTSLVGAASAHAGILQSATLQITTHGQVFNASASGAVGSSTASSATLAAGQPFATTLSVHHNTFITYSLRLGNNGAVAATAGGVSVTGPVTGSLWVYLTNLKGTRGTVSVQPILAGGGSFIATNTILTVSARPWRVGQTQLASTGMTHVSFPNTAGTAASSAAQTHLTATGSFNLTAGGGGTVTLVSLTHVKTLSTNTASPAYLTLTYAAPEPGTLLLLGAGVAGLLLTGRRLMRS